MFLCFIFPRPFVDSVAINLSQSKLQKYNPMNIRALFRMQPDRLAKLEMDDTNEIIRRLHRLIGW